MRRWVVAGVVALVGVVAIAAIVARNSDDSDGPSSTPIPPGGRLDAGGEQLSALLAKGRRGTWHAVYELTRPEGESEKEKLEVWRSGDRTRQDSVVVSGAQPVHTIGIRDGKGLSSCRKVGSGKWNCEKVSSSALDPDASFAAAIGEFGNSAVTPRQATIGGHAGTCFAIAAGGTSESAGEVCVSADGVPLRIAREGASIELVSLDTSVKSSDFKAPA